MACSKNYFRGSLDLKSEYLRACLRLVCMPCLRACLGPILVLFL